MDEKLADSSSKRLIAGAALALFAEKGFESVGVNEIAAKAARAKPSLYHHFGSKTGLLCDIFAERGAALLEMTRREAAYQHDIVMNLRNLFGGVLDFARSEADFFRLMLRFFASRPQAPGNAEAAAPLRAALIAEYRALFAAAAGDHGNMRGREVLYAETFWALSESCAALELNGVFHFDQAARFRTVHQYMHGIFS
ncbi:MAG: TetR/AcrR family transcriptional regulator [Spirochaetaceae bacterium]|jgi:TetR/AcrR family transcriptional regulator|nr:TetR/AcrR family transcriptional regulator [Spirochaetaceae bacterium]